MSLEGGREGGEGGREGEREGERREGMKCYIYYSDGTIIDLFRHRSPSDGSGRN